MRKFITKTFVFLSIPLICAVTLPFILDILNKKIGSKVILGSGKTAVLIGDSHIEAGIVDSLLPGFANQGLYSESLYFSYYKLKTILEHNPSIKNVYLGFGYHTLSEYYKEFTDGKSSSTISSRYFYLLPTQERANVLGSYKNELFSYMRIVLKVGLQNVLSQKKTFEGGYTNAFANTAPRKEIMEKRIRFQYYEGATTSEFYEKNIEYLEKIIELCKSNKANLTLINTPLHPYYKTRIPEIFIKKYEQLIKQKQLKLIDLTSIPLPDSCYIPDGDHVSRSGSVITTNYLRKQLGSDVNGNMIVSKTQKF